GYKYNLSDVHSAIGLVQLQKLEKNLRAREKYAKLYDKVLGDIEGVSFQDKFDQRHIRHALHLYLIILDPEKFKIGRDEIVMKLRDEGIFAVVHYKPLHLHKFHREKFGYKEGDFSVAEKIGANIITLPLLPSAGPAIAKRVAETTKKVLLKYKR
ncbi:MAG: DegT/DnrJ/EryC1/StrS aminotransferase family protein, partial [Candidatus Portnoybacteria bacterium]|nr:DegT/DnrJ/EryC1/StrS aminotransferase family protein [Candidatus Portnoybacteria bacterium]